MDFLDTRTRYGWRGFAQAALLTALLLVVCGASPVHADSRASVGDSRRTVAVALMHRHGARTGPQITKDGMQWGNAVLSPVGEEMALGLGVWLRRHYTIGPSRRGIFCANDSVVASQGTSQCIGSTYSSKQIISQSTYFERTIRTAMGMIRGMFADDERAYPFIQHSPGPTDMKLGYYYSWPSASLHRGEILGYNAAHDNQTLDIMSQAELDEVGSALASDRICRTQQTLCILLAQDVTACNYANDPQDAEESRLPEALLRHWPKFRSAQQLSNAFLYMYNSSQQPQLGRAKGSTGRPNSANLLQDHRLWERTGTFGRVFTREVATLFADRLASFKGEGGAEDHSPLLFHYSAHDVTIYGVQVAIGAITIDDMYAPTDNPFPPGTDEHDQFIKFRIPEFTSVIMFDLLEDGNVSVGFARPPQVYGADFSQFDLFSSAVVRMTCEAADGSHYRSNECPLEDFTRYTDRMKPLPSYATEALPEQSMQLYDGYDSASYCFVLDADLAAVGCERTSTAVPMDEVCLNYRRVCPALACEGPRYALDMRTMACIERQEPAEANPRYKLLYGGAGSSRTLWFYTGSIVGGLLLGIVLGVAGRIMCYERKLRFSCPGVEAPAPGAALLTAETSLNTHTSSAQNAGVC